MKRALLIPVFFLITVQLSSQTVANYTFSAVSGTFNTIQAAVGTVTPALSTGGWDDGYINNIPIGFSFTYDGVVYTQIAASTNGWFKFGGTASNSVTINNLNTGTTRPLLAPLWDDNEVSPNGIMYRTTGIAPFRIFTVEWNNCQWNYLAAANSISFQVKLYEGNSRIDFVYRQEAGTVNSASASIGICGATSGQFLSLNGTGSAPVASSSSETTTLNTRPATGQIYRFDPYPVVPKITSVTPITGFVNSTITISGSGFSSVTSQNIVYCGAVKATVSAASSNQLTVVVPNGTDYRHITVTNTVSDRIGESNEQYSMQFGCGGVLAYNSFAAPVNFSIGPIGDRVVEVGDIDGDGKIDIAATISTDAVRVFRNISSLGSFTASSLASPVDFPIAVGSPSKIVFADMDCDGKKDVVVSTLANGGTDSVSILRNTATSGTITTSSFAPKVVLDAPNFARMNVGDIDCDGRPDLIMTGTNGGQLVLKKNLCTVGSITTATFGPDVVFPMTTGPGMVESADLDGDGKPEIIIANQFVSTISVFPNTCAYGVVNSSSLGTRIDFAVGGTGNDFAIGDLDGDGKQDIVISMDNSLCFSVFPNTSTPGNISFGTRLDFNYFTSMPMGCYALDISDLDGDGKPDLAIEVQNQLRSFKNISTVSNINFQYVSMNYIPVVVDDLQTADLDGDCRPEVIMQSGNSPGNILVLYNQVSPFNTIAPTTELNATSFCDIGLWKTYYKPGDNTKVLFAVKDNGNNLGTITVDEYRDPAPGNYLGNRYLQRHFRITPTSQPATPVQVRLYFTNAELANLTAVDPSVASVANLSVTKYDGPTEDGTYNPLDATSLVWYAPASITTGIAYGGRYLEFTVNSFSEFWIHGGSGVLPIELISFDAQPVNHSVDLSWQTASETNNDFFTIERSQDGYDIESIDTIDGAGNSTSVLDYHTTDGTPYDGLSYYRLKQVDYNGHFSYSEWKNVYIESAADISIYPNPTDGNISMNLTGEMDALWTMTIMDLSGKTVIQQNAPRTTFQSLYLDLSAGSYIVRLESAGVNYSQKLVITDK